MKKYRLKKWYPSLFDDIEVGTIVNYEDGWIYYTNKRGNKTTVEIDEEELSYEDFWELIEEKKPLFITDDGVKVFDRYTIVYSVRNNASAKIEISAVSLSKYDFEHKVFFHESNADEYIWRNKRVFSYEDVRGRVVYLDHFEQLAKGRSKE